jgi:SAM-dependent methyltransferase
MIKMNPNAMTPFGLALLAYFGGETSAQIAICRDDGLEDLVPVSQFYRSPDEFLPIEVSAIERCQGHVLDIGAGTGIHSLVLQSHGRSVTAIDISPQAVEILTERGIADAHCVDVFDFEEGPFDTLLMLGHGIGMVEDIPGLTRFLAHAHRLTSAHGQILLNSLDVRETDDPDHLAYHEANRRAGRYIGEVRLQFEYRGQVGPYCGWLHVDPQTLCAQAGHVGWECEIVLEEGSGDYLARLTHPRAA